MLHYRMIFVRFVEICSEYADDGVGLMDKMIGQTETKVIGEQFSE